MVTYADVKRRTSEILDIPSDPRDRAGQWFDVFIMTLIVLNAAVVMAETVRGVRARYGEWLAVFEALSLAVFVTEYAVRVWSSTAKPEYDAPIRGRLRFMATPYALIDLIAILPAFAIGIDLRFVRVLRILRLLKLTKYADSVRVLRNVIVKRREELTMATFLLGLALVLTSSFMYYAERDAQPEAFSSIPEAMWWGIVTLTTTGYGDVVPITVAGRILGGVATLIGLAFVALPVGILASGFTDEVQARKAGPHCPHCGERL